MKNLNVHYEYGWLSIIFEKKDNLITLMVNGKNDSNNIRYQYLPNIESLFNMGMNGVLMVLSANLLTNERIIKISYKSDIASTGDYIVYSIDSVTELKTFL